MKAEAGTFGTTDIGLALEGPVVKDKLLFRFSGNRFNTTGQYKNELNASQKLGARRTTDSAATLFATPTDGLAIKARAHAWKDNDGPSAAFGYGVANGADVFNCNLGGTAGRVNGNNNYICGTPRFPWPEEIALDVVVTPEIKNILLGNAPIPPNTLQFIFTPQFLDHFGLERHAREASLVVNYEMQGGIVLSSITAAHSDKWAVLDDLDKRPTAALGAAFDSILLNNTDFHDFSQEVRATSDANQSLRWLIGGSFADLKGLITSGLKLPPGTFRSNTSGSVNNAKSQGIFGSLACDITDQLVINGEARRQYDKISDGLKGGLVLSKTFKSFTPRVILDYKPTDDITSYSSWAKGTRPGAFNPTLVGRPQSELDQVSAAVGAAIAIPEEQINNYEVGFKGKFWDGRASMTAALYTAKWRSQQSASAVPITRANGTFDLVTIIGAGGKTNLSGVEVEAEARATEKLTVEGTFAFNRAHIITRDCSDCQLVRGVNNAAGREMSRTPRYKGTASVTYTDKLVADYDWFTRADYIYTGDMFESEANATTTGASSKVNIRAGVENEMVRLEFYGTNIFNDKTFTSYQRLTDFSFAGGRSFLSVGLPNKPAYGARASYKF